MAGTMEGVLFNWMEIGKDGRIISCRYIRLDYDKQVVWDEQTAACGRWFGTSRYSDCFFLEFSASGTPRQWRKHILQMMDADFVSFILLPYAACPHVYDSERWWHDNSEVHSNENTIIMWRVDENDEW